MNEEKKEEGEVMTLTATYYPSDYDLGLNHFYALAASVRALRAEVADRNASWKDDCSAHHVLSVTLFNIDRLMSEHAIEK